MEEEERGSGPPSPSAFPPTSLHPMGAAKNTPCSSSLPHLQQNLLQLFRDLIASVSIKHAPEQPPAAEAVEGHGVLLVVPHALERAAAKSAGGRHEGQRVCLGGGGEACEKEGDRNMRVRGHVGLRRRGQQP
jgi:hypothetical protein